MLKQMADLDAELDAIRRMIPPARMQIQGGGIVGFANLGGMGGFGGMLPGFGGLPGGFGGMVPGNNPFIPNGVPPINIEPRLGITVQKPMPIIIDQLDLPVGQGIIIQEMVPNGLAAKAGLKVHDILLEIGGKSVPSVPVDFISTLRDMKADAPVDLVLLRKGRKETIKGIEFIDAPKVEAPAPLPPLRRGNSESSSVQIINNQFTIEYGSGELQIVIRGMIADRQPTPEAITIRDGDKQTEYKALKDVPEAYQETVTRALKSIKVR